MGLVVGPLTRQIALAAVGVAPTTLAFLAPLVGCDHVGVPRDLGHVVEGHVVGVGEEAPVAEADLRGDRRSGQDRCREERVAEVFGGQVGPGALEPTEQHLQVGHGQQGGGAARRLGAEVPLVQADRGADSAVDPGEQAGGAEGAGPLVLVVGAAEHVVLHQRGPAGDPLRVVILLGRDAGQRLGGDRVAHEHDRGDALALELAEHGPAGGAERERVVVALNVGQLGAVVLGQDAGEHLDGGVVLLGPLGGDHGYLAGLVLQRAARPLGRAVDEPLAQVLGDEHQVLGRRLLHAPLVRVTLSVELVVAGGGAAHTHDAVGRDRVCEGVGQLGPVDHGERFDVAGDRLGIGGGGHRVLDVAGGDVGDDLHLATIELVVGGKDLVEVVVGLLGLARLGLQADLPVDELEDRVVGLVEVGDHLDLLCGHPGCGGAAVVARELGEAVLLRSERQGERAGGRIAAITEVVVVQGALGLGLLKGHHPRRQLDLGRVAGPAFGRTRRSGRPGVGDRLGDQHDADEERDRPQDGNHGAPAGDRAGPLRTISTHDNPPASVACTRDPDRATNSALLPR